MEFGHFLPHFSVHSAVISIGIYSYIAVFLLALAAGHAIPLPEEVILLVIGYCAGVGIINFWLAFPIVMLGLLIGDLIWYAVGHHGGKLALRLEHRLPQKTINRYHARFRSKPMLMIIALRFVSGLRILSPIFAAVWKIPLRVFIAADILALVVFTLLFTGLGYWFNATLYALTGTVSLVGHLVFLCVLAVIGIVIAVHGYRLFFSQPTDK